MQGCIQIPTTVLVDARIFQVFLASQVISQLGIAVHDFVANTTECEFFSAPPPVPLSGILLASVSLMLFAPQMEIVLARGIRGNRTQTTPVHRQVLCPIGMG